MLVLSKFDWGMPMWRKIGLLFLLMTFCGGASAQWYTRETGEVSQDTDERKSVGGFGGWLLLTDEREKFLHDWTSAPVEQAPKIHTVSSASRSTEVTALLFYGGCGQGVKACDATVDFKVLRPDGSTYGEQSGEQLSDGKVAPKEMVRLSQALLSVRIESADPLGVYQVLATINEPSTGTVMRLKQTFSVVP
jgi:hypothetical protein